MFGAHNRDELRQAYSDAWRKQLAGSPLTPLEAMIADVVGLHPEYQTVVHSATELGGTVAGSDNPFLHMGLHMAIREQIAIDRPPGVLELHRRLLKRCGNLHDAEHILMEALAQTLWEAQRAGTSPDEAHYLELVRRHMPAGRST